MPDKLKLKKIPVGEPTTDEKKFMATEKHPDIRPPHFRVDDRQIPEIKTWPQGGKYRLVIDIEMKTKNSDEQGTDGGFDILAYKVIKKKSIEEMTDEEFGEEQGRRLDVASKN